MKVEPLINTKGLWTLGHDGFQCIREMPFSYIRDLENSCHCELGILADAIESNMIQNYLRRNFCMINVFQRFAMLLNKCISTYSWVIRLSDYPTIILQFLLIVVWLRLNHRVTIIPKLPN